MSKEKVLVSSCLLGNNCKYNGGNNRNEKILKFLADKEVIMVCPEVMGGLSIPRLKSEITSDDRVINELKEDVTNEFLKGAKIALELAIKHDVKLAIVKEKSPSCGKNKIYNGEFNGTLIEGSGIFTRELKKLGVKVLTEEDFKN